MAAADLEQYQAGSTSAHQDMDWVGSPRSLRVLFLVSAHGGLSQAAEVALSDLGHQVTVRVVASAQQMQAAVDEHDPDLIACPMLTTMIPEQIWSKRRCLIVHPGPVGDRGPSSIDWAIEDGLPEWGVTVLQANGELDAGTVWATRTFTRRSPTKSGLYRHEVRRAAVEALVETVTRIAHGQHTPPARAAALAAGRGAAASITGRPRPLMRQDTRRIDWSRDPTDVVLRKIRAADSRPGVLDRIGPNQFHLYGAHPEATLHGEPGQIIAQRHGAVCRATVDGAVWITHLKQRAGAGRSHIKLPAVTALALAATPVRVPEISAPFVAGPAAADTYREIRYVEDGGVGYLHFDFYNGAMNTDQCQRLLDAYRYARSRRTTRVIVLMGGRDFFCTGIHLNVIEASADPAGESWQNLNAINDVVHDIITTNTHYLIAALRGDTAAGGVPLALAADRVVARTGIVLNPYYQHMGGLYGSEYWTYLLPRRVGPRMTQRLTSAPFTPISAHRATHIGLLDASFGATAEEFQAQVTIQATRVAHDPDLHHLLNVKRRQRTLDERAKPLHRYRRDELARSRECFYGPDQRYHQARRQFTRTHPHTPAATPA
jgi:putative two-component system hydrogenase maturation factor HypX/HoxX